MSICGDEGASWIMIYVWKDLDVVVRCSDTRCLLSTNGKSSRDDSNAGQASEGVPELLMKTLILHPTSIL